VWSFRAHRWLIPAESEITVKLCFSSDDCGQFDETLNFEIVGGAGRRHQLHCRGVCTFPAVSTEPRYTGVLLATVPSKVQGADRSPVWGFGQPRLGLGMEPAQMLNGFAFRLID